MQQLSERDLRRHRRQSRLLFARNYAAHGIEGGLYIGATALVSVDVILPTIIGQLAGEGSWLLAAGPIAGPVGFNLLPLLVAHRIQRMHWHMPLIRVTGILQRLPYLIAGLIMLLLGQSHPTLALASAVLCPFISGILGGYSIAAWQELVAKTIPAQKRSSLWAIRAIIGGVLGLAGGLAAQKLMRAYPGTDSFGMLHLGAFVLLSASMAIFLQIRETNLPPRADPHARSLASNLRSLPGLLSGDHNFRTYVLSLMSMNGLAIIVAYLPLQALSMMGEPTSTAGFFVTLIMLGGLGGNLLAGWAGDRFGVKGVLVASNGTLMAMCIWAMLARSGWEFYAIFALLGAARSASAVGSQSMSIEICPLHRRATYLSVIPALTLPAMLGTMAISSVAWKLSGHSFMLVAGIAGGFMLLTTLLQLRLKDPRRPVQGIPGGAVAAPAAAVPYGPPKA